MVHLMNIFTITMAIKVSLNVKFVVLHLKKLIMQLSQYYLYVHTVVLLLQNKSNVRTLKYINARIQIVHTIKRILRKFLRILILQINTSTSFTIYIVSLILISLKWTYTQYQSMPLDLALRNLILT